MSSIASTLAQGDQPFPADHAIAERLDASRGRVRRLGSVRLPIAGPYYPKATAYRLPDGRIVWCVRLWEVDRPVKHCVPSETVRGYCEANRLASVLADVLRIEGR